MVSSRSQANAAALALFAMHASTAMAQFAGPIEMQGCYSSATGLTFANTYQYQSQGSCQTTCNAKNMPVMGLTAGSDCWCGSELPPTNDKVEQSQCSHVCNGYQQSCTRSSHPSAKGSQANEPSKAVVHKELLASI